MASHQQQPSPPGGMHLHHGPPHGPPSGNPAVLAQEQPPWQGTQLQQLAQMNEAVWMQIGNYQENASMLDEAIHAYEQALRTNPRSIPAMNAISAILRTQEQFHKAVEYLNNILKLDQTNGDVWGSLGHCHLMMDDLQAAYSAYQQALYHLRDPKEPKLWYGIGILYDRYGSLEHAEEAFSQVMRMQPDFEKSNEIYFRLGIIYKQQQKYSQSLECFRYIISFPPSPLTEEDIWFQIGHVHEQQKDYDNAKAAYRRVLDRDPTHAKVLQQLGWLHHQQSNSFSSQDHAIEYLEKSVRSDQSDAQSWYLLGRCYMSQQKYPKAYEAYQQAVYRDGRNPTFWCSIGVLYYQINQYRDALDAYSRAIRLNPFISEVWYDLGTLYESCNNQITDALDAYQRAAELDPSNVHIKARLQLLRNGQSNGIPIQTSAPLPQDVHPQAYQVNGAVGPPGPQWGSSASQPGPQGPAPGPGANGWQANRLADINPPPQPPNPYDPRGDRRDAPFAAPPLAQQQRAPSPRQEQQMRPYQDPIRHAPPQQRPASPPRDHHPLPGQYNGPPGPPLPPQQSQQGAPGLPGPPQRVMNPNYAGPAGPSGPPQSGPLPPTPNQMSGPGQQQASMPPYGRPASPRPEIRPILDHRMSSPRAAYMHQQYPHQPDVQNGNSGIAGGAPPPAAALAAAEAAANDRAQERPSSVGPKRHREWEEETSPVKKPASDENRARMEDMHHRRPSTPSGEPYHRSPSEARRQEDHRRAEDQRRANENYHPSEAAHHPPTHNLPPQAQLPPMQSGPTPVHEHQPPPPPPVLSSLKDERERERERRSAEQSAPPRPASVGEPERAARKMDVDEDYDDEGEEEKKGGIVSGPASGPGSAAGEKVTSPTVVNGHGTNGQSLPKVEASA